MIPSKLLGDLSPQQFLEEYWQKRPLLIRNAFPDIAVPLITADELAGLACETDVESRLVFEQLDGKPWQVRHGPFDEQTFASLPEERWSLLVQGLDHWVPEVSDLLAYFDFIPNWRIDDVMASFAPRYGSVGPHYDQYDVFLIQAEGQRRWQTGPACGSSAQRLAETPLRILANMEVTEEWVLNPGDMLYLPPTIAHHGVALNDCITLSVGFRSPSHEEILTDAARYAADQASEDAHLPDQIEHFLENPGEIPAGVINQIRDMLIQRIGDTSMLEEWFGQYATAPKSDAIVPYPETKLDAADLTEILADFPTLRRNEGTRFAFSQGNERFIFFYDGERLNLTSKPAQTVAQLVGKYRDIDTAGIRDEIADPAAFQLLLTLINRGSLYLEEL